MMGWWVVLGEVITPIIRASVPINSKYFFQQFLLYPMVVHIPVFGSFTADGGSEETLCSIVIFFQLGRALGVVKFFKGDADQNGSFTIMLQGAYFLFSCGGHDVTKCNALSKDGPVGSRLGNMHIRR